MANAFTVSACALNSLHYSLVYAVGDFDLMVQMQPFKILPGAGIDVSASITVSIFQSKQIIEAANRHAAALSIRLPDEAAVLQVPVHCR